MATAHRRSTEEFEQALGAQIRAARLAADLDQLGLARAANINPGSLRALEHGKGSTLRTLIRVVRVLDLTEWLDELYPMSQTSPLELARQRDQQRTPRRASNRRRPHQGSGDAQ